VNDTIGVSQVNSWQRRIDCTYQERALMQLFPLHEIGSKMIPCDHNAGFKHQKNSNQSCLFVKYALIEDRTKWEARNQHTRSDPNAHTKRHFKTSSLCRIIHIFMRQSGFISILVHWVD